MRSSSVPSRLIELRHLRYFLALADAHSFTLAARRLNVTQPTLSHQIKQLETAIGAFLFERRSKDVELSQAGRLFRPYCERMLKELELGALALSELEGLMRGTLRMAVSHSFSSSMLPNRPSRGHRPVRSRIRPGSRSDRLSSTDAVLGTLSSGRTNGFLAATEAVKQA